LLSSNAFATSSDTDEEKCLSYIRAHQSYKDAHKNKNCLKAAKAGISSAQYIVGMSYGFAGNHELEKKYYRLAANNKNIAAYLSLGHVLRDESKWEAIYWYQRYVATKTKGYGYAALLISDIFNELGDDAQSKYWREVCRTSSFRDCDN